MTRAACAPRGLPAPGERLRLALAVRSRSSQPSAKARNEGTHDRRRVETELRPTGDARSPWVGVLRYCERGRGGNTVLSELFRYEAGEWVD